MSSTTAAPSALRPPTRGKVHARVTARLASEILGGIYPPGAIMPQEEALAVRLGVSRISIREAVKVLTAKGLVEVRPRIGIRVRPRTDWSILDPDLLAWHPDLGADPEVVHGLLETRRLIEPATAELAAQRATGADLAAIEAALIGMERAIPDNLAACCEADLAFHSAIIVASHNLVLRGLVSTIRAALGATFAVTNQLMASQTRGIAAHRQVLECIRLRDGAAARAAMNHLLDVSAIDLSTLLPCEPRG